MLSIDHLIITWSGGGAGLGRGKVAMGDTISAATFAFSNLSFVLPYPYSLFPLHLSTTKPFVQSLLVRLKNVCNFIPRTSYVNTWY